MNVITKLLEFKALIKENSNDDERQHSLEDAMHLYFIENVHTLTKKELTECQKVIAEVKSLDFSRWCA